MKKVHMNEIKRIKQAIIDFVKGGDKSDVQLLDTVLHKDFRVCSYEFMGKPGLAILDKNKYLENIKTGVFGGVPREMKIEQIDKSGKIASVKLLIESSENHFLSYNSLVLDTDKEWKIIQNLAHVIPKKDE